MEPKRVVSNFVKCSCCSTFFAYNGETTTLLLRHILKCAPNQPSISNFFAVKKPITIKEIDMARLREAAIKFVVKDLRPFYAIEGDGLNDLCKAILHLGQKYPTMSEDDFNNVMPSRQTVSRDVIKKSDEVRNNIKDDLKNALKFPGGFACTSDLWTDNFKRKSYLSITVHMYLFIDGKVVPKIFIINMNAIDEEKKTGAVIFGEIIKIFSSYGLTETEVKEKNYFITDRGGNMKTALADCKRINCYAHVINNIVQHMCSVKEMSDIITKAAAHH